MHMSRKRNASSRARASEMTRQKMERRLSSNEDTSVEVRAGPFEEISERTTSLTTEESSSVAIVSFEDLPAPLELNMRKRGWKHYCIQIVLKGTLSQNSIVN